MVKPGDFTGVVSETLVLNNKRRNAINTWNKYNCKMTTGRSLSFRFSVVDMTWNGSAVDQI